MNYDYQIHVSGTVDQNQISYAFQVINTDTAEVIHTGVFSGPESKENTIHLAEYKAVFEAITWLYKRSLHKDQFIAFFTCSELVFKQMNGELTVGEYSYKETAVRCLTAKDEYFWCLDFEQVSEDDNAEVIALAKSKILQIV